MLIQPPATLLMGGSGSGKTSSLCTYIPAGLELFVLVTEPGGAESLLDWCETNRYDVDKLHWATAMPITQGWDALESMVTKISALDFEALAKIKSGIGKDDTRPAAMKFLNTLKNFKCERTGKDFGDVTTWGPDRAFALDSLSGFSQISWALTVGHKPTAHQGEWSIAMNFISDLIMKISTDRSCFFTMTSHVEKEINELTGVNQIMASTLGRKLAPKLPRFFSEVVYAKRIMTGNKADFTWATCDQSADLKNRALTIGDKLPPTFLPIVERFRSRLKAGGGLDLTRSPASPAPGAAA